MRNENLDTVGVLELYRAIENHKEAVDLMFYIMGLPYYAPEAHLIATNDDSGHQAIANEIGLKDYVVIARYPLIEDRFKYDDPFVHYDYNGEIMTMNYEQVYNMFEDFLFYQTLYGDEYTDSEFEQIKLMLLAYHNN